MYLRRNSRFRYVPHTLIHNPKPITTDPMTMCLRWRRSWYDLGHSRYVHADQLTFWVQSNRRYWSRPYKYMRRPLPTPSSCPSAPWIRHTVPCFPFKFWNRRSVVSLTLTDGTASKRDRIDHHQNRQKDRIFSGTVWNIISRMDRTKPEWMDGIDFLNDAPLILRGLRPCQSPNWANF